jgi:hypothetical protein
MFQKTRTEGTCARGNPMFARPSNCKPLIGAQPDASTGFLGHLHGSTQESLALCACVVFDTVLIIAGCFAARDAELVRGRMFVCSTRAIAQRSP